MYQAEQAQLLAEEQFGSQKFKSAIPMPQQATLLQPYPLQLTTGSTLLQQHKKLLQRITLLAATLCLCRLGGPQLMVSSMISTIHKMEHHIHTTFSDSTISASHHTWTAPITGIGQGNGAGPQIRATVSSPILDIMRSDGFYVHLIAAISLTKKLSI